MSVKNDRIDNANVKNIDRAKVMAKKQNILSHLRRQLPAPEVRLVEEEVRVRRQLQRAADQPEPVLVGLRHERRDVQRRRRHRKVDGLAEERQQEVAKLPAEDGTLRQAEEVEGELSEAEPVAPDVDLGDQVEEDVLGGQRVAEERLRQEGVQRFAQNARLLEEKR